MRTGTASSSAAAPLRSQPYPGRCRANPKPDSGNPGMAVFRRGPGLYPLRAILEERSGGPDGTVSFISAQGVCQPEIVRRERVWHPTSFAKAARATRCRQPSLRQFRTAPGI
jgi:hypothetical protein